jgi:hypothetical protein
MADMHNNSKEMRSSNYEIPTPRMAREAIKANKVAATLEISERKEDHNSERRLSRTHVHLNFLIDLVCKAQPSICVKTFINSIMYIHVKWVPCHHGMVRPQVVDRGDGLQIWRVAANILNKQSRTADRRWPSSLGVGRGANNPPP